MASYKMTCSCGDSMTVEAATREEAVKKAQAMMPDQASIDARMKAKHSKQPTISVADCHAMIAQQLALA